MRFKNLDLNLLVALDALLATRSVSESARRLNLSQPAMSAALARLRAFFDDALLVPIGRRMVPTAYGESLAPLARNVLGDVEALVATSSAFDPATSQRVFRLGASDYISLVLVAPLLARLSVEAPGLRIEIAAPSDNMVGRLEEGEIDLLLTPEEFLSPDHPAHLLFEETHVVVGWSGNPALAEPLDEATFYALGHVAVEIGRQRTASFGERHMARIGPQRRIEVIAPSFTTVPWMLPGTQRIAVMHDRLARAVRPILPLKVAPLPFPFPVMREMVQHHRTRAADPGVRWLIDQLLAEAGRSISPVDTYLSEQ